MKTYHWNEDKKHRCPNCHTVALWDERPRWWRRYRCYGCGSFFAGWGRRVAE